MSAEEDTELRDLVIESLEKKGILGKIKAELRATVFLALEETDIEKCKISLKNEPLQKFMETEHGQITVALVKDFLQQFNLDYTIAVFEPEVSIDKKLKSRKELEDSLNLKSTSDKNAPLISLLLNNRQQNTGQKIPYAKLEAVVKPPQKDKSKIQDSILENKADALFGTTAKVSKEPQKEFFVSDDAFFDDPIPSDKQEPLLFSFLGKSDKSNEDSKVTIRDKTFSRDDDDKLVSLSPEKSNVKDESVKSNSGLASLKDLPSLMGGVSARRKGSEDYEDDFQASLSLSGKSDKLKLDGEETELSIEEEIDDLLNSASTQGEDVTSDHTVSQLSGPGTTFDYVEKLP